MRLDGEVVVGYEALARGPEGTDLASPDALFAAARVDGRLAELDWACQLTATRGAAEAGLQAPMSLFVNAEPAAFNTPIPAKVGTELRDALHRHRVVLEVTERALAEDPASLLRTVARAREVGCVIALDDVGAVPESVALLPFVEPDVIKVDGAVVRQPLDAASSATINAVRAQAERTGAALLAEGIETDEHLGRARSIGATLGQGWHFGRPGPLPFSGLPLDHGIQSAGSFTYPAGTPFEIVSAKCPTTVSTKRLLIPMSRSLEDRAMVDPDPPTLLAAFQHRRNFTPRIARRFNRLAHRCAFVAAMGVGLDPVPAPGVRGSLIEPGDPLLHEWSVIVVGPHFAAALVARDLGDDGPDLDRRWSVVVTYQRELVVAAARSLMGRVLHLPAPDRPRSRRARI